MGWMLGGWLGELIGNDWMLLLTGALSRCYTTCSSYQVEI